MSASISSSGRRWPSWPIQGDSWRARPWPRRSLAWLMSGERSLRAAGEARLDGDVREILGGQRRRRRTAARRGTARRPAGGHCPASRSASAPPARRCRSTAGACPAARRCAPSKWRASAGMSPLRSRSGGMVTVVAPIRSARRGSKSLRQRAAGRGDQRGRRPNWSRCSRPGGLRRSRARGRAWPGFRAAARRSRRAAACRRRPRRCVPTFSAKAPGKAPFDMAEQVAVDDVGGDRLAVDLDERPAWRAG